MLFIWTTPHSTALPLLGRGVLSNDRSQLSVFPSRFSTRIWIADLSAGTSRLKWVLFIRTAPHSTALPLLGRGVLSNDRFQLSVFPSRFSSDPKHWPSMVLPAGRCSTMLDHAWGQAEGAVP